MICRKHCGVNYAACVAIWSHRLGRRYLSKEEQLLGHSDRSLMDCGGPTAVNWPEGDRVPRQRVTNRILQHHGWQHMPKVPHPNPCAHSAQQLPPRAKHPGSLGVGLNQHLGTPCGDIAAAGRWQPPPGGAGAPRTCWRWQPRWACQRRPGGSGWPGPPSGSAPASWQHALAGWACACPAAVPPPGQQSAGLNGTGVCSWLASRQHPRRSHACPQGLPLPAGGARRQAGADTCRPRSSSQASSPSIRAMPMFWSAYLSKGPKLSLDMLLR